MMHKKLKINGEKKILMEIETDINDKIDSSFIAESVANQVCVIDTLNHEKHISYKNHKIKTTRICSVNVKLDNCEIVNDVWVVNDQLLNNVQMVLGNDNLKEYIIDYKHKTVSPKNSISRLS